MFADVLDGLTHRKLKVYIYGASTKGNTIIQYLKVGPDVIKAAIDKDPEKFGKYMQTGIPITDDANIKDADVLWCIPYGFVGAFKKKEKFRGRWMVISPDVNFL